LVDQQWPDRLSAGRRRCNSFIDRSRERAAKTGLTVLVWKEIIGPGTYWYRDQQSGLPRKFVCTPKGVDHLYKTGSAMLSDNLSIPVPLEHQPVGPQTPAEKAARQLLNNTGWIKKYAVKYGKLFGLLDIQDESIVKKLPQTIRYTSPHITSFTDGNGKRWDGVIGHLALTSRPRITNQQPFPDVMAALSLAQTSVWQDGSIPESGVVVSRAGLLGADLMPKFPAAFSIWSGISLAEMPPEMKKDKEADMSPDKDTPAKPQMPKKEGDTPEMPPMGEQVEEEMDLVDVVCDVMSIFGVDMPEGTSEENLLQNLLKGLMEKLKSGGGAQMADTNNQPNTGSNQLPPNPGAPNSQMGGSQVVQEAPPMYMSLSDIDKQPDPMVKSLAKRALLDALARRNLRVEQLARRLPQRSRDNLVAHANSPSMALSLGSDGEVRDPMASMLQIMEDGVRDLPQMLKEPTYAYNQEPHPQDMTAGMTEERRQAIVAEWTGNTGLQDPNVQK
jgi:hypothetical protein